MFVKFLYLSTFSVTVCLYACFFFCCFVYIYYTVKIIISIFQVFLTAGLGGMSGAQAKAAVIAGCIGVVAEV